MKIDLNLSNGPAQHNETNHATPSTPDHGISREHRLVASPKSKSRPKQTIDNPFLTFDDTITDPNNQRTELGEYVHQFARHSDLEDRYELLLFGARLARDKHEALSRYAGEITDPERILLGLRKDPDTNLWQQTDDSSGFWKQSKFFRATILTASLGGVIQGWTQSTNNGTAYGMPDEFSLCIRGDCSAVDLWTFGMLNAIPFLSAGLFGTTIADPLQENVLGRRGSIMLSCALTIASTIGTSVTQTVGQLAACRAINGIALGAKASIIPIYSAEISPEHIRGAILANWQLADAAGIFFGFLANLIVVTFVSNASRSWRILTNTVLIPTLPLLTMIYLMPESPRYLMKHGKYRKALEVFTLIQTTPLLASRDFMYAHAQLDFESRMLRGGTNEQDNLGDRIDRSTPSVVQLACDQQPNAGESDQQCFDNLQSQLKMNIALFRPQRQRSNLSTSNSKRATQPSKKNPYSYHIGVTGYFRRLIQLWKNKRCRRALLSASISMISQQMTGVNTIAFLSTIVWQNSIKWNSMQDSQRSAKTAAVIGLAFGAANFLGGLPAYWLSDKIGRSIMLVLGFPNMAWSMLTFAFMFKISDESPVKTPMVSILAVVFVLFYGPTAGTSPFSISAEVFPLVSREAGMAVSVAVNFLGLGILVLVFPFLMHRIGITSALSIFAGLNLVALVFVYLFVPETRLRTLEELQYTFDLSTKWHIEYRAVYILKHVRLNWWRYLTRRTVRPPIPFYRWARITYGERGERIE